MKNKRIEDLVVKVFADIYVVVVVMSILGAITVSAVGSDETARFAQLLACYILVMGPTMAFIVYEITKLISNKINKKEIEQS